jgi:hypothetical protein
MLTSRQHYASNDIWPALQSGKNMVPVVFGGVEYSKILPENSYIDALNQEKAAFINVDFKHYSIGISNARVQKLSQVTRIPIDNSSVCT